MVRIVNDSWFDVDISCRIFKASLIRRAKQAIYTRKAASMTPNAFYTQDKKVVYRRMLGTSFIKQTQLHTQVFPL